MPGTKPTQPPVSHQDPAHQDDLDKTPKAETARQEGAQGRVVKTGQDTVTDGNVDSSDPAMTAGRS